MCKVSSSCQQSTVDLSVHKSSTKYYKKEWGVVVCEDRLN